MSWLQLENITKRFPGVLALDKVSLELERGGCHALIGENGAGKSTLGKILAGVYTADEGRILVAGEQIAPANPLQARQLGIAMVHQELAFCPNLTVAENLCLGDLPRRASFLRRREMRARAKAMLAEIEADIDLNAPISVLSTGQEQMVQIAAALGLNARIIVFDEPTSSLSSRETEHLFALIKKLKTRGVTLLYVSHRMEEIFRICDTVTVLRDGRHVATEPVAATSQERVIRQMIGRELVSIRDCSAATGTGEEVLRVQNFSSPGKFRNIHFSLRAGEILGLGGLIGAGRSELAAAIFGLDPAATGQIQLKGRPYNFHSVQEALAAGVGFLPEDRKKLGLVLSMNCRENTSLAALPLLTKFGLIGRKKERSLATQYLEQLRVKTPHLNAPISGLSGGNQQKIAFAKWLARRCQLLIVDEPTRGVDVGAKAEIHKLILDLAKSGAAVLLISSELPELMSLSHRVVILREGVQMGELTAPEFSEEALMRLMAGVKAPGGSRRNPINTESGHQA
jgi:ABC-type sugar transport system ATPase subunit